MLEFAASVLQSRREACGGKSEVRFPGDNAWVVAWVVVWVVGL